MLFKDLRLKGRSELLKAKISSFKLDADLLLLYVTGKKETALFLDGNEIIDASTQKRYLSLIQKRASHYPLAYITGYKDFWSLTLKVNESTLIPRPDTETLVETALKLSLHGKVLDLGTGTGAIILSLKKEAPSIDAYGVDFKDEIVSLARHNATLNNLDVTFFKSSWFDNVLDKDFDFILSNPPYIKEGDPNLLSDGVLFEPSSALTSKNNGLYDIECIIKNARDHLVDDGYLLFEHGYDQADKVLALFTQYGYYNVRSERDLAGILRVTYAQKKG